MKRLFLKKISLVLVLVMLLSLTGVAEDGGTEVTVTAIDVDEIVIPAFEDLPDQAGLDLSIESSLTVEEDEEDESSTEAPLSESASDDNAVRENALPKKITLGVKETYTLSAKNATFKSSKTSVATVNKKGVITAKKKVTFKRKVKTKDYCHVRQEKSRYLYSDSRCRAEKGFSWHDGCCNGLEGDVNACPSDY